MAVSGTQPSNYRPRVDVLATARWVRRVTWIGGSLLVMVFFTCFGSERVPLGMNTLPDISPGALCIIDRRDAAIQVGRDVFVEVDGLGLLLSRVVAADGQSIRVEHQNPSAAWPDSRHFGALPRTRVRSTVIIALAVEPGR